MQDFLRSEEVFLKVRIFNRASREGNNHESIWGLGRDFQK